MSAANAHKSSGSDRYIPALTGLRAIAAYLVFLHHYNPITTNGWLHRLVAQGYIGVTIFFVLSGFLIYHRYARRYIENINWSWKAYYQNRFARIGPLYYLLLLLTIAVATAREKPMSWLDFTLNTTLGKGLFDDYKFSGIAQSWSLTVEECFYLFAPWLFIGLRRWGAVLLTAFLMGIGLLLWLTVGSLNWHGLFGNLLFVFFYTFFGRAFEFFVGMWLARQWHQDKLPRVRYPIAGSLAVIVTCVGWQTVLTGQVTNTGILLWSELIAYNFILPIGVGLLLLGLLQKNTGLRQFLVYPVIQALGRSSYAFYLIHSGVISKFLQHTLTGTNISVLFVLLVLIAHGLYNWVEKPLQRWLRAA